MQFRVSIHGWILFKKMSTCCRNSITHIKKNKKKHMSLGDFKLVPLLPRYLEKALALFALQFSRDNSADSPVNIGLKISQEHVMKHERELLTTLINSPYCCLLINSGNDAVVALYICVSNDYCYSVVNKCNINDARARMQINITSVVSKDKVLMNNYLETHTIHPYSS